MQQRGQQPFKCPPPPCHQKGVELFSQAGATHFHGWKQFGWMDSPVRYGPTPNRPPLAINTRAFPKSMQICHLIGTRLKGQSVQKKVQNIFLLLQRVAPNGCNGAGNKRCLDLSAANLLHTCPGMSQFYILYFNWRRISIKGKWCCKVVKAF